MNAASGLELTEDGDGYILSVAGPSGESAQVKLTAEQVLVLAQSAPLFRERVLLRRKPKAEGVEPVLVTQVVRVGLNEDMLRENILLTMIDNAGASMTFALPPEIVTLLAQRLPARLAEMLKSQPRKQ
jgi:hypothetical protein